MSGDPLRIDDLEALRGDLPPHFPLERLEWWKLQRYVEEAILAQGHELRGAVFDSADPDGGVGLELLPVRLDERGVAWLWVRWRGRLLAGVVLERLLPGAPLRLRDMRWLKP